MAPNPTQLWESKMYSCNGRAPLIKELKRPPPGTPSPLWGDPWKIRPRDVHTLPHRGGPLEKIGPRGADLQNPYPHNGLHQEGGAPTPVPLGGGGGMHR